MNRFVASISALFFVLPAVAEEKTISCGNKWSSTVVTYEIGRDVSVKVQFNGFSRGPVYTSTSEGSHSPDGNRYYVKSATTETTVNQISFCDVKEIPGGFMVTLDNPRKSTISFVKKDGQLIVKSANKDLLDAVVGKNTKIDCSEEP